MRFIGSRAHGMMDYPMGALMMSAPLLFKMDRKDIATWIPVAVGVSMTAVAAMTNFEAGVKRKIPFRTHLLIDAISGIALAASPWLFRSRNRQWIPHVIFGMSELMTSLMTKPELDSESSNGRSSKGKSEGSRGKSRSRSRSADRSSSRATGRKRSAVEA